MDRRHPRDEKTNSKSISHKYVKYKNNMKFIYKKVLRKSCLYSKSLIFVLVYLRGRRGEHFSRITAAYPRLPSLQGCLCQGTPGTKDTHCSLSQAQFSSGLSMSGCTRNYKTRTSAYSRLNSLQGCLCQGASGSTRHALQLIPGSLLFRVVYVRVHQELRDTHCSRLYKAPFSSGLSMSG
jgi:hypothetical protein